MSKIAPQVVAALIGAAAQLPAVSHSATVGNAPDVASPLAARLQALPFHELRSVVRFLAVEKSLSGCALWTCKTKSHGEVGPS